MNDAHITGFGHVGLFVHDMEASLEFYGDVLGFTVMSDWSRPEDRMRMVFMQNGSCVIELCSNPDVKPGLADGPINHLAMIVSDMEGMRKKLQDRGVVCETPDVQFDAGLFSKGAKYLIFRGPNGERLQIVDDFMK
jgi:lactoylglutathione lyase